MKIFVLNQGSSSIKCSLYEFPLLPTDVVDPIWKKEIPWKNVQKTPLPQELQAFLSLQRVDCIGHRVVHGGDRISRSVFVDVNIKRIIRNVAKLAPLHNFSSLRGINKISEWFPEIPQVAVFDTSFHRTLPKEASVYPGPRSWMKMGIQRFGFHGISFQYCARRVSGLLKRRPQKMVVCHLGSGASLCAIKDGVSVDTTMGFTPLEGLMMNTRSGTVDPGILLYLLEKRKKNLKTLSKELYKKSGLLGLSGGSSDMRDLLKKRLDDDRVQLALDVYLHRLTGMIGSMVVSLGGLDTLVFTAGIGENSPWIRERVCERLSFLGISLNSSPKDASQDFVLSSESSKVQVAVIHTQEAFEIARECFLLMNGQA